MGFISRRRGKKRSTTPAQMAQSMRKWCILIREVVLPSSWYSPTGLPAPPVVAVADAPVDDDAAPVDDDADDAPPVEVDPVRHVIRDILQ